MTEIDIAVGPTEAYWSWLREGRLRFQRCAACQTPVHRPRLVCTRCGATDLRWEDATGSGTVYSVTTVARPPRSFRDEGSYQLAMVDLDSGPRVLGRVVGPEVRIGQQVRFVAATDPEDARLVFSGGAA